MSDDRVPVTTRVPAYQKDAWLDDADELGMSQSEFVRTMVQAGRRELDLGERAGGATESEPTDESADSVSAEAVESAESAESADPSSGDEPRSPGVTPGVDGLEDRVLSVLESEGVCSWDDLLEMVVDDFEERLDETMTELTQSGPVTYSGRKGGYVLHE